MPPVIMKASEARRRAEENAPAIAERQRALEAREAAEKKKQEVRRHEQWRTSFEIECHEHIRSAVKRGETTTQVSLDRTWTLDVFVKEFEFIDDIRKVILKLNKDGYVSTLERDSFEVDSSAAYLNSGGECGRERPYWTSDIVLTINW